MSNSLSPPLFCPRKRASCQNKYWFHTPVNWLLSTLSLADKTRVPCHYQSFPTSRFAHSGVGTGRSTPRAIRAIHILEGIARGVERARATVSSRHGVPRVGRQGGGKTSGAVGSIPVHGVQFGSFNVGWQMEQGEDLKTGKSTQIFVLICLSLS